MSKVGNSSTLLSVKAKAQEVRDRAQQELRAASFSARPADQQQPSSPRLDPVAVDEDAVRSICEIGFSPVSARLALARSGGDLDAACGWLLEAGNAEEIRSELRRYASVEWALKPEAQAAAVPAASPRPKMTPPSGPPRRKARSPPKVGQ